MATSNTYVFAVSGVTTSPTAGAVYSTNGINITCDSSSISAGSGTATFHGVGFPAAPNASITKVSGTGDASIAYTDFQVQANPGGLANPSKGGNIPSLSNVSTDVLHGNGAFGPVAGTLRNFQLLTSTSAAQTYTPTAGTTAIYVEAWGGGGAGGSTATGLGTSGAGAGGASGSYCAKFYATIAATYTYQCGAAGTAGAAGNHPGGDGLATTFDVMTAGQGHGGAGNAGSAGNTIVVGGAAVASTGGDINGSGAPGESIVVVAAVALSGAGGSSAIGGGGQSVSGASFAGNPGTGYASGGSGGVQTSNGTQVAGGAGTQGIIRVWEFR